MNCEGGSLPYFLSLTQFVISLSLSLSLVKMGRQPCCEKVGLKKGPWTAEEDKKLINFMLTNGQCCWRALPKLAGKSPYISREREREINLFCLSKNQVSEGEKRVSCIFLKLRKLNMNFVFFFFWFLTIANSTRFL